MTSSGCPVHATIIYLEKVMASDSPKTPKTWRIMEEIYALIKDIAWGSAGEKHLASVIGLCEELAGEGQDTGAAAVGGKLITALAQHREVFESHIATHNCAAGDCVKLTPAPCQMTCPAGIDVPTYVTLIGEGKDAEAIEVIRKDNPFPWVCGLVCTRPCEFMCVRGRIDQPVAIKALKAFAAERAMSAGAYINPAKQPSNGKKVCVVGAGPGGMSAAYYLALKGYTVRIIEALPVAGGMIMVGIPRYRLPREVIDHEVALLQALGIEFQFSTRFGRDVTYAALKSEGFEAFFLAIGAHRAYKLGIAGEDAFPQVIDAITFLKDVALGDHRKPGEKVVVIGGGNVAIDAARTSLRLGCREVVLAYRRTRDQMPADEEEVEQAEEEGVHFSFLTIPVRVEGSEGNVQGLTCVRAELVRQAGGSRISPKPIEGSEYLIEADVVISAIGQRVDHEALAQVEGLQWTRRDTIDVNMATMETSLAGVFAAGDAVTGPATVIEAIGGGKRAAQAIDRYFEGIPQPQMPPVPMRRGRADMFQVPASTKMVLKRPEMPLLGIDRRRTMFQQVELGFSENSVREEARRCLRCDICRRCGDCVSVCRDKMGIDALKMGYLDFDHPVATDFRQTEENCILCGACAANCPNAAMTIEDQGDERVLSLCGTILNRQKLIRCADCHTAIGPLKYIGYIRKRTRTLGPQDSSAILCDACARKRHARYGDEMSTAYRS